MIPHLVDCPNLLNSFIKYGNWSLITIFHWFTVAKFIPNHFTISLILCEKFYNGTCMLEGLVFFLFAKWLLWLQRNIPMEYMMTSQSFVLQHIMLKNMLLSELFSFVRYKVTVVFVVKFNIPKLINPNGLFWLQWKLIWLWNFMVHIYIKYIKNDLLPPLL